MNPEGHTAPRPVFDPSEVEDCLMRVFDHAPLPMVVSDASNLGPALSVNQTFLDRIACKPDQITSIDALFEQLIDDESQRAVTLDRWAQLDRLSLDNKQAVPAMIVGLMDKDGVDTRYEIHLTRSHSKTVATFVDVTFKQPDQSTPNSDLPNDILTGLLNRDGFDAGYAAAWKRASLTGSSLAVLILDVDFFKQYNNHYGQNEGDSCLVQLSTALLHTLRVPNDVVARYGGEEFAVVVRNRDEAVVARIAQRLVSAVEELKIPHSQSSVSPFLTVSVGVHLAFSTEAAGNPQKLLKLADRNLCRSKAGGRNCVTITSGEM